MKYRYGIDLSRDVTEAFVKRLIDLAFLKQVDAQTAIWVQQTAPLPNDNSVPDRLDSLVQEAAAFHEKQADLLKEAFDEERFLQALLTVLLDQNDALQAAVKAVEASEGAAGESAPNPRGSKGKARNADEFLASEFIAWTAKNKKDLFEWLADLAGTAFVSEALIEIRTPQPNQNIRPDLHVYLDTPFLMELLGCSGRAAYEDAKQIIATLKSLHIGASVMEHSLSELHRNLDGVLKTDPRNRTGPSAVAILNQEVTIAHLEAVRENPEHFVTNAGLQVVDPKELKHLTDPEAFTDDDEKNFYASILSLHNSDPPRWHDVQSVAWIMRRRKGDASRDILKAKHILLTRNAQLVRSATRIATERCGYARNVARPAILVRVLAGILWLIVGQQERAEISRRQLILSCDRARSAAPQIVQGMYDAIRAVDEKNADLFWASVQMPAYLSVAMKAVAGATPDPVETALESIRADLVREERAASADKLQRQKAAADAEASMSKRVIESLEGQNASLERESEAVLDHMRTESRRLWNRRSAQAKLAARAITAAFHMFIIATAIAAAVSGTDKIQASWWVKAAVALVASIASLYLLDKGLQAPFRAALARHFNNAYEADVRRLAGPSVDAVWIADPML